MPKPYTNPQEIAEAGRKIYADKYQADYERRYPGQFVAIDVESEEAFVAQQPEEAVKRAREALPQSLLHLIKIGSSGAFRVSYTKHVDGDWLSGGRHPSP
jgi:hypothetical protein